MSNVAVCVRFRPLDISGENNRSGLHAVLRTDDQSFTFKDERDGAAQFSFDRIFYENATQAEVYESVALPIVKDAMDGVNGTILAYGQTGAGKTHTMEGPNILKKSSKVKGILPRVAQSIFEFIEVADATSEFIIKLSMVEIYKERIRDLFQISKGNLQVKEDKAHGIYVAGATEIYVQSEDDMLRYLDAGATNRAVGATQMNGCSSRSHCVYLITIQQITKDGSLKSGKLYLVDLAGSEKVEKTGAEGKLLCEAKTINKSLSALGNVINALATDKPGHIPYRDSKLTRILQESLIPSKMVQSPTKAVIGAKQIKNKPKVNTQLGQHDLEYLLKKSEEECEQLRNQLCLLSAGIQSPASEGGGKGTREENRTTSILDADFRCDDMLLRKLQQILHKKGAPTCNELFLSLKELFMKEGVIPRPNEDLVNKRLSYTVEEQILELDLSNRHFRNDRIPKILNAETPSRETLSVDNVMDETVILLESAVETLQQKCQKLSQENEDLKTEMYGLARLLMSNPETSSSGSLEQSFLYKPKVVRPIRGRSPGLRHASPELVVGNEEKKERHIYESQTRTPFWISVYRNLTRKLSLSA